jgi:hypothetical protein
MMPTSRELNRRQIHQAERFVISSIRSDEIATLVAASAHTVGKPRIDLKAALDG